MNVANSRQRTVVDKCLLTKFKGGLQSLYEVEYDALNWLKTTATSTGEMKLNQVIQTARCMTGADH